MVLAPPDCTPSLEALDASSCFSLEPMEARRFASSSGMTTPGNSEASCFLKGLENIRRGMAAVGVRRDSASVAKGVHEKSQGRFVGRLCCAGIAALVELSRLQWRNPSWRDGMVGARGPWIKLRRDATRYAGGVLL